MSFISVLLSERSCVYLCAKGYRMCVVFFCFPFYQQLQYAEICVTATDTQTNRQRQYKENSSISFQICNLFGVTKKQIQH